MNDSIPISDEQVVDLIRNGQAQGISHILEHYRPYIIAMARTRVGLSYEDAEELLNDVVLEVVKKIEAFDHKKASLNTWIIMIARRRALDRYRKKGGSMAETQMPDEWWDSVGHEDPHDAELQNSHLDRETHQRTEDTLVQLSERDRDLLRLRAEGHSLEEMADWLGQSKNATTVAYSRAKQRFMQHFENAAVPEEQK
ncbi:MAG TPA: RNA polymerase sigma factor [Spirochaetia bacterium]|nr:RNA polymerase sigma factor [Spirochaetia bacterium]